MYRGAGQVQFDFGISKMVKYLIILNVSIWLVFQVILEQYAGLPFSKLFALYPAKFMFDFHLWQAVSYMFLHTYQVSHILFNMLMLWFLGTELEKRWGSRFFLNFYLMTGVGAALIYCAGTYIYFLFKPSTMGLVIPVMGASGAVFGLLLAYGILFGERTIYFMMLFPMKAKYFVMILGAVEVASLLTSNVSGGDVAYLAHLGGLASGYIVLLMQSRLQRLEFSRKAKKKQGRLKLVVDNEKETKKTGDGPKYWN